MNDYTSEVDIHYDTPVFTKEVCSSSGFSILIRGQQPPLPLSDFVGQTYEI